jgi:hypothetical protein
MIRTAPVRKRAPHRAAGPALDAKCRLHDFGGESKDSLCSSRTGRAKILFTHLEWGVRRFSLLISNWESEDSPCSSRIGRARIFLAHFQTCGTGFQPVNMCATACEQWNCFTSRERKATGQLEDLLAYRRAKLPLRRNQNPARLPFTSHSDVNGQEVRRQALE